MANTRNTKAQYLANNNNLTVAGALVVRRSAHTCVLVLPCGTPVQLAKNATKALLKGNGGKGPQGATYSLHNGTLTTTLTPAKAAPAPKAKAK